MTHPSLEPVWPWQCSHIACNRPATTHALEPDPGAVSVTACAIHTVLLDPTTEQHAYNALCGVAGWDECAPSS